MIYNYLKVAIRTIRKHPLISFINIVGLGLSLCVCMMVMIRIEDAFDVDKFHAASDRTYRITSNIKTKENNNISLASSPLPLREAILNNEPSVQKCVTWYPAVHDKAIANNKSIGIHGAFTGPEFFEVFGFNLVAGVASHALEEPNSIVLTKETAEKIFGKREALHATIKLENIGACKVTGIINTPPGKSHLVFDALVSISTVPYLEVAGVLPAKLKDWDSFENAYTYVLLKNNSSVKKLESTLDIISRQLNTKDLSFGFGVQALHDISPAWDRLSRQIGPVASWGKILTEAAIALLILVAACFNYINLTIARALNRGKEVGIRKVAGASRFQVFLQYIFESVLVALLAFLIGYASLSLILKHQLFNDGYKFLPPELPGYKIAGYFLLITICTGFIAGAAPAWILSAFRPVNVLKNISGTRLFGNVSLQKILIVFQFSLSLTIIIFLSIFYRQFAYMASGDYGFRQQHIVSISLGSANADVLRNELKTVKGVGQITKFSGSIGKQAAGSMLLKRNKDADAIQAEYFLGDEATMAVFDFRLIAGENLRTGSQHNNEMILLNEKAVQAFQFGSNQDALGKQLWLNDSTSFIVSGVMNDFHYAGLNKTVKPLIIKTGGQYTSLYITTTTDDYNSLAPLLENAFKKINPYDNFSWSSLSRQIKTYNDQSGTINLLGFLAFMTIFIASFGLLGLVIYSVETKRKEISIRKILGAGVAQLMILLSGRYFKLLLIAASIAMPIGYALSYFFLLNFEYRVKPGLNILLVSFLFLLVIGLSSIISQTYKASIRNPADNLRSE